MEQLIKHDSECVEGQRKCGVTDDFHNQRCVPYDRMCPINELIFIPKDQIETQFPGQ